jgi:hypothetical protein
MAMLQQQPEVNACVVVLNFWGRFFCSEKGSTKVRTLLGFSASFVLLVVLVSGYNAYGRCHIEDTDDNNHLQPWMIDKTLPAQLAVYSKTWSLIVERLQNDFVDTTVPLATRRCDSLLPGIAHVGFPELKQSVSFEMSYNAQKGGWVFRLIRGLLDDPSKADLLLLSPQTWALWHRDEPLFERIADGKIAAMPSVLDFPVDEKVEAEYAARQAKAKAAAAAAHAAFELRHKGEATGSPQ